MKKALKIFSIALAMLIIAIASVWNTQKGQDWLLEQAVALAMNQPPTMVEFDGLKVFLCGTSSPLPAPNRAQACVLILAGNSLYLVDAGAGSAQVAMLGRVALENLDSVFLTHYHSDHIAALPEFNLNSWVAGRDKPLTVYGPTGVSTVVSGLNQAYSLDSGYRVAHHGEELLPSPLGVMQASVFKPGETLVFGDLTIKSFMVNHDPIHPAVGYRFDYRGRSVVISGDTVITPTLIEAAAKADLLLQDALSLPIIQTLETATAGTRNATILHDIQGYHAHVSDLESLVEQSGVKQLALYHLIPPPQNPLFEKIYQRELPDNALLTVDGMIFELPAGSKDILVIKP